MLSDDELEHVVLDSAFNVHLFGLTRPQNFRGESGFFDASYHIFNSSKEGIIWHLQSYRPSDDERYIKGDDIVPCENVRVDESKKLTPSHQQILLFLE